ncbi:MAG TPA: DNA polymerase/3'-5' exonuclease PolX [Syntrophales bacterium]|nr:DNA polymerase/3'-5' exonuclease PolX [Syntrophales bacterium]
MTNSEIATVFLNMADLLEMKNDNPFKIRAYRRAAESIKQLPREMSTMLAAGEDFREIPGVGEAVATKSEELLRTGRLAAYEELKAGMPPGVLDLMAVPGVGPKTAYRLAAELDVRSVDDLERAAADGRIASLTHMGEKTAEKILREVRAFRRKDRRYPLGAALPAVEEIMAALRKVPGVRNLTPAGSLRRFRETVGDIDIMATAADPEAAIAAFVGLPQVVEVLARGTTKASVLLPGNLQADLRIVAHESFGSLLQHFTGSRDHNIALRAFAQRMGLSLSEYGIADAMGKIETFTDEASFYGRLGLAFIPPEVRENQGEIDLAAHGALPRLLEPGDVRGDFHTHTDWSDGQATLEEMAAAAEALGYEYLVVTDHSAGLGIANGLAADRLRSQAERIRAINRTRKRTRLLAGVEVNIKADGRLALSDEALAELDVVIAAVHSSLSQSEQKMTRRVVAALENPHVDILAHPTCRLIGRREPASLDMAAVIEAAARWGKALEINAMPDRLDLNAAHIRQARDRGVMLAIGTDAHAADHLSLMRFGIGTARRGWCGPKDVLNTRRLGEVLAWLRRPA